MNACLLFCIVWVTAVFAPAEIIIDLSVSRDVTPVLNSGAKVGLLPGSNLENYQSYRFEDEEVHWIFPEGIEIRQGLCSSIFDFEDGRLYGGSGVSDRIMPIEDAVAGALNFINKIKPEKNKQESLKKLEEWYEIQRKKVPGAYINSFGAGIISYRTGFKLAVKIRTSINPKYPVTLDISFGWIDESKIRPQAEPLNLNTGIIELLPIGNKVYERSEAYGSTKGTYHPAIEAWMQGDRSHPEEVMKVLEDFNKQQQESYAKTKKQPQAKDTPPPPPVPSSSYGYMLWIPFAGLGWWLYRRVCKASQN